MTNVAAIIAQGSCRGYFRSEKSGINVAASVFEEKLDDLSRLLLGNLNISDPKTAVLAIITSSNITKTKFTS